MSLNKPIPSASRPAQTVRRGPVRFEFIDALRGWAFLGVLVFHSALLVSGPPVLLKFASQGEFGVQLFYVISAATLFLSLSARWNQDSRPFLAFFVRRLFRIAPMFWLAIVFYVWWRGLGPRFAAPDGISWKDIAVTVAFAHGWHPTQINAVVPGGWSVAVEMSFYLLMPLLFSCLRCLRHSLWLAVATTVAGEGLSHYSHRLLAAHWPAEQMSVINKFTFFWLPAQLPIFALGGVLYFLLRQPPSNPAPRDGETAPGQNANVLLCLAVFLAAVAMYWQNPVLKQHVVYGIVFVLLAWSLSLRPIAILVNPVTRYLGTVSFSAYLTHFFALDIVTTEILPRIPWTLSVQSLQFGVIAILGLLLTVLISSVTYRLVELPGQQLGKAAIRFLDRRFPMNIGPALASAETSADSTLAKPLATP